MRFSPPDAEYMRYPVTADRDGVTVDLSAAPIVWAFLRPGQRPSDPSVVWRNGDYVAGKARIFFDPAGFGLAPGYWDVFLKITSTPELFCKKVGQIVID